MYLLIRISYYRNHIIRNNSFILQDTKYDDYEYEL